MATCKYCGKSGFFVSVGVDGLCSQCTYIITPVVERNLKVINESIELIRKSKNFKTRLSRCDLILEIAEKLMKYENKGILVITPTPSEFISVYSDMRDKIILENLKLDTDKAEAKINIASTPKAKVSELDKVLIKIQEYKKEIKDETHINKIEKEINKIKHETQLNAYLEAAKKAVFKGQNKKALDQYQEALYFLKNDNIDDDLQKEHIQTINKKITELNT